MRDGTTDHEKRMELGALVGNPQTSSSPELISPFATGQNGRPRSWSSQIAPTLPGTRQKAWSIRSGTETTPSQPKLASTLTGASRRVEARGRIHAQPHKSRPSSSASMSPPASPLSKRKQALDLMKPLVAANPDPGSSTDAETSTVKSGNSHIGSKRSSVGEESQQAECSADVLLPQKSTAVQRSPRIRHRRYSGKAQAVIEAASASKGAVGPATNPHNSKSGSAEERSYSPSLWTTLSRLTLRGSASTSQSTLGSHKSAVDHLKSIEDKQPTMHVAASLGTTESDSASKNTQQSMSIEQDSEEQRMQRHGGVVLVEQSAGGEGPFQGGDCIPEAGAASQDNHSLQESAAPDDSRIPEEGPAPDKQGTPTNSLDTASDIAAAADSDKRSTQWLSWWPGAYSQSSGPETAESGSTARGLAASHGSAETDVRGHNRQQQRNMLVPDFEVGSNDFPVGRTAGSRPSVEPESSARRRAKSAHALGDDDTEVTLPLRKRLRTLGQAVVDSALEMAPGWARAALWRQTPGADVLGQSGREESGDYAMAQADEAKKLMDAGARGLGKVAVIGIHGWFPMRMLQMLAGEPTGRSEKFCAMMRDALKEHLSESHGVDIADDDISLFPLIGEGRIEDRVELLLSQITEADDGRPKATTAEGMGPSDKQSALAAEAPMPPRSRRAEVLQAADTVFVVTHSQGTPVAAMVIERLLEMGLVDTDRQRVAMLAMAGISHGPMPYLKDNVVVKYIESDTARELFELMDPSSYQSQRYVAALSTILHSGVRLVCIGSWVDEVVPLYSAILQGVSHPNVYRAVYIDAPHYLDDFLTNLIVFALRLRNMGFYDHGLLIHLSEVVAGSLWGHWGHSTVYGEPAVYRLAIKWLLYSTSPPSCASSSAESVPVAMRHRPETLQRASGPRTHMSYRPFNATEHLNPFFIPWIMRTLWDEPAIQNNQSLRDELKRLVALFDKWAPETKVGKDLKYRLEPVRAAL